MVLFDHLHVSLLALPVALTALGMLTLGIVAVIRERGSRVGWLFFSLTLSIVVWLGAFTFMYSTDDKAAALRWAKAAYLGVPFIPTTLLHSALAMLGIEAQRRRLLIFSWITSVFFSNTIIVTDFLIGDLYRYWWGFYPKYGWLSIPFLTFFFGTMFVTMWEYWRAYRRAIPGTQSHARTKALMTAFGVCYLGSVDYLAKYGLPVYPFGYLPIFAFLVLTARALWRYKALAITPSVAASRIIGTMGDSLLVCDADGIIRVANHAACAVFGYAERELVGGALARLVEAGAGRQRLEELMRRGEVRDESMVWRTRAGEPVDVSLSISSLPARGGTVLVVRDIRERKRAEHELQTAQLHLVQAAKLESVGRLAAGIAHEVKNPLAIIMQATSYLGSLPALSADRELAALVEDIERAVRRADSVIRGLLDFAAARKLHTQPEPIQAAVEDALELVKHEVDRAHLTVIRTFDPHLPPVRHDRQKIGQVFVNLLMNAIHSSPEGGRITVRTANGTPGCVTASIEDAGAGIAPADLPRVFDPFFTTKPTGKGTGLGLSVSRSIVDMHGGTITLANRPGGGVAAVVTLPTKPAEPEGPHA
jgi:PAS domain S-box-containing protein